MLSSLVLALMGISAPYVAAKTNTQGLELVYSLELATQGINISPDGRKFLTQYYSTTAAPEIVELLADNSTTLYPDAASSDPSSDPSTSFVSVDGARIGPDGRYWVVNGGSSGVNKSTKLVGVNLTTNAVSKLYYLDNVKAEESAVNNIRFNTAGNMAYLSDPAGALIILNITIGNSVRMLSGHSSAQAWFPIIYNHTLVPGYGAAGSTLAVGLDQIKVSPDGVWLYYQPCSGGLYKIETAYVDAALTNATLAASLGDYSQAVALTPSTGGTTIDGNGNIYFSDTNLLAIWKVTPEGVASILFQDDRMIWTDLMWVTPDKKLWLPASQMRPGGDGLMAAGPNYIFTYPIEAGPSPTDHA